MAPGGIESKHDPASPPGTNDSTECLPATGSHPFHDLRHDRRQQQQQQQQQLPRESRQGSTSRGRIVATRCRSRNHARQVLLGIPAYARHLRDPSRVKTFGEIYDDEIRIRIRDNENENENESDSSAAAAANKDDDGRRLRFLHHSREGYEWDSPARIRAKVDLARQLKLGGIFFWELGQDKITTEHPSGVLLESSFASAALSFAAGGAFSSHVRDEGETDVDVDVESLPSPPVLAAEL
mmetsp:Transcript_15904/g.34490  ORF Transcript_15904/g.34490 Transcript_15904/m.34490 type:complete len:239 (+) Transcript_15904:295-1011(+)